MIQIEGLTQKQLDMLDTMWAFDEKSEFDEWFDALTEVDKKLAEVLAELVRLELLEEDLPKQKLGKLNKTLQKFMLNRE